MSRLSTRHRANHFGAHDIRAHNLRAHSLRAHNLGTHTTESGTSEPTLGANISTRQLGATRGWRGGGCMMGMSAEMCDGPSHLIPLPAHTRQQLPVNCLGHGLIIDGASSTGSRGNVMCVPCGGSCNDLVVPDGVTASIRDRTDTVRRFPTVNVSRKTPGGVRTGYYARGVK